jgi:hypothetical protein
MINLAVECNINPGPNLGQWLRDKPLIITSERIGILDTCFHGLVF